MSQVKFKKLSHYMYQLSISHVSLYLFAATALIMPILKYTLISIYNSRESPGNPWESPKIKEKCYIMQEAIPRILVMQ